VTAIVAPSVDTRAEVRIVGTTGLSSLRQTNTFAKVVKLSDNSTVSAFTAATAGVAGSTGLVPAPAAGDHAATLLGNATWLKNNLNATAAPSITDDAAAGYAVGSKWIDLTNDEFYICVDASAGSAVWNSGSKKAYARMRRTTGGAVNTNTLRPISNWTNVDLQTNVTCDATSGLFTVLSNGVYKLFFHVAADDTNNDHGIFAVVNGIMNTNHLICAVDEDSSSNSLFAPSGEIFLSLSANDTVGIWFGNHTTGAAISDSITVQSNTMYANLVKL